jgi:putative endonuclease
MRSNLVAGPEINMNHSYYVYILASQRNGTLYTGITRDLHRRVWEHQNDVFEGFTKKYGVHRLVWFEFYENVAAAIAREKRIKKWNRAWKITLIEKDNPNWSDLFWKLTHPSKRSDAA